MVNPPETRAKTSSQLDKVNLSNELPASRFSCYSELSGLPGCSPDGVDPTYRMGCPFNGIGSASSDSVPMGHSGGASRLKQGLCSGQRGRRRSPHQKTSTAWVSKYQISSISCFGSSFIALCVTQAVNPNVRVLNSLRLSKTSPRATYHRASTSLRMMATMALTLMLPSRFTLFWYQAPITRSR